MFFNCSLLSQIREEYIHFLPYNMDESVWLACLSHVLLTIGKFPYRTAGAESYVATILLT